MKRKLPALLLLAALMSGFVFYANVRADAVPKEEPAKAYNAQEIYGRAEQAVFYIRAMREDGSLKDTGTGVVLSAEGTAATACHVIAGADSLEAIFGDGRKATDIKTLGCDTLTDAAILKLPLQPSGSGREAPYRALQLREAAVVHGEKVFAIGYPMKDTPIITEGIVNAPNADINGRPRILTSAQVVSGMSGGPLIDESGELVGILSGSLRTMEGIHLAVDAGDIRSLLPDS